MSKISAAKVILKKKRRDHATPLLKNNNNNNKNKTKQKQNKKQKNKKTTLASKQTRIDFKIATLAYRHFNKTLSSYLSVRLTTHTPSRSLRYCSAQFLSAPRVKLKTAGERSFRFQVSRVWNSLPIEIRQSPSLSPFKTNLKTCIHTSIKN